MQYFVLNLRHVLNEINGNGIGSKVATLSNWLYLIKPFCSGPSRRLNVVEAG